jgi:small GTP-binding protein
LKKEIELDSKEKVNLYIWDTAGQERFHSLMPLYTRACDLAIITTAIDDSASFDAIPKWIELVAFACDTLPPLVLAVNKTDLAETAALTMDEIHESYEKQFRSIFFVSAKTGENCEPLIQFIAKEAADFNQRVKSQSTDPASGNTDHSWVCC